MKIRAHAVAQVDCFADVNDFVLGIAHEIDAGVRRQGIESLLDFRLDLECHREKLYHREGAYLTPFISLSEPHPYPLSEPEREMRFVLRTPINGVRIEGARIS